MQKKQLPLLAVAPRLAVHAVKGAPFAFTGAKRKPLTEEAHGLGAGFCQEGQTERTMTEPNNRKGPGSAPGPNRVFSQNGASSESAVDSLGGVCSSCSLLSSLRTTSARMDHDVSFVVFDFLTFRSAVRRWS